MSYEVAMERAKKAVALGATRICLGAAWREVREGKMLIEILKIVEGINALGVEVCCTLGMLELHQAEQLKKAGAYAYNHNLDSSETFYKTIITTRSYQERLDTLDVVKKAGLSSCCGGIFGMEETTEDRLELLSTLADLKPDSVPLNLLTPIPGTPMADQPPLSFWEFLRLVAIARILIPKTRIRLSSGRKELSIPEQALCFFAGANSIHMGEKLLTMPNASTDSDRQMFEILGLHGT